jgi:hypothetical protein
MPKRKKIKVKVGMVVELRSTTAAHCGFRFGEIEQMPMTEACT